MSHHCEVMPYHSVAGKGVVAWWYKFHGVTPADKAYYNILYIYTYIYLKQAARKYMENIKDHDRNH